MAPDPVRRVGPWRLVALAETELDVHRASGGLVARGSKAPVALLAARGGTILAFDAAGRPIDPGPLLARVPALAAALSAD